MGGRSYDIFWREVKNNLHCIFFKVKPSVQALVSLSAQLLWREYFYTMAVNNMNYDKMENNPICLNIPWYENAEHEEKWTKVFLRDTFLYFMLSQEFIGFYKLHL